MIEAQAARAQGVAVAQDSLIVDLVDGRTISVPIVCYPRLLHGTPEERSNWRLIGGGEGIHWPDLDEYISVANLLAGHPSGESQRSFKRWLEERASKKDASQLHRALASPLQPTLLSLKSQRLPHVARRRKGHVDAKTRISAKASTETTSC